MEDASQEEAVLIHYLLGELPEEKLVEVEDRAFSDPEYLRLVEAVEADLIDAYVRHQLQGEERRRFEERFFVSPERRKKVEFARAWAQVSDEARIVAGERAKNRKSVRDFFSLFRPAYAFSFAMAAAAVILAGLVVWQAVQSSRLRERVSELEAERVRQQQREQTLASTLKAEQARTEELNAQLQHGVMEAVTTLALLPGAVRDEAARPQIVVPASAQLVRMQVQLEPRDDYPQFRAELRTQRGGEILTRGNLHAQPIEGGRVVVLDVPAGALGNGDYELTLQGMRAGRKSEDVGYYHFSVRR